MAWVRIRQQLAYGLADEAPPVKCAIILHPSPQSKQVAVYASVMKPKEIRFEDLELFTPDLTKDKVTTMNKTQRVLVTEGEKVVHEQDKAMWITPNDSVSRQVVLAVTAATQCFLQAAGHVVHKVGPGRAGENITNEWLTPAEEYISWSSPQYIYDMIRYDDDDDDEELTAPQVAKWNALKKHAEQQGVVTFTADSPTRMYGHTSTMRSRDARGSSLRIE